VWAWGSTGEEEWNPGNILIVDLILIAISDMEIGMDFKSLVRSALLPLTTDFFPDVKSLGDYNFTVRGAMILKIILFYRNILL
jgi:hypothetical protein